MQNDRTPAQKEKRRQEEISSGENLIIKRHCKSRGDSEFGVER